MLNVVSVYAPQVGLTKEEKENFWTMFDTLVSGISSADRLVIGGDFNGHVGRENVGFTSVHGGWGYGSRNKEGETILEEAVARGLVILNTVFKKQESHLVTYESGDRRSQIDYIMTTAEDKRNCTNCKVIPGEWEEGQHKLLVTDLAWRVMKPTKKKTKMDVIKWGKIRVKEKELRECFVNRVNCSIEGDVEKIWGCVAGEVRNICKEVFGVSRGGKTMISKDTWWWKDSVQSVLKEKKRAFKEWKALNTDELLRKYKEAKRAAKRAVAIAKSKKYDEVYERLGTREGEKDVYKIAKSRARREMWVMCSV